MPPTTDGDGSVTTVTKDKDGTGKVVSKRLKVSSTLTTIPAAKFADQGLTSVSLPPETTTIANRAFAENRLTYLPIAPAAASISPGSTPGSPNLNQVFLSSINFNQSAADTTSNSLIIPPTVTSIGPHAFAGNPNLKSVTISQELLNTTPSNAFPPGVTFRSTAGNVIARASNNQTIIDADNSIITVVTKADGTTGKILKISPTLASISASKFAGQGITEITISNSIISIGSRAFMNNRLTSAAIPDSVISIGSRAFMNNRLTSVTIPSSVISIGSQAFMNNRLTSVTIPSSVISIGSQAFMNNRLASVTIPNSVMFIDNGAFSGNTGLTSVTLSQTLLNSAPADTFPAGTAFKDHDGGEIIRGRTIERTPGPDGFTTVVIKDTRNNILNKILEIGSSVRTIVDGIDLPGRLQRGLFKNKGLTDISFISPSSLSYIGHEAFRYNNLTSVTIPNSVTNVGWRAFSDNKLTSVTIPNSVTRITYWAFSDNSLTSVTIPNSVTQLSGFNNNLITNVTIPSSVTTIGREAFMNNYIHWVRIPDSVTYIGHRAFKNNRLSEVTIPNSVTSIGDEAFMNNSLTGVTIPSSVTSIGDEAFMNNYLTSVTIPSSVTSIGDWAFFGNLGLTSVTISQTLLNNIPYNDFPSGVTFIDHSGYTIVQGGTTERTPGPNGFATIVVKDARNRIISKNLEIGPSVTSITNGQFTNKGFTDINFISPSSLCSIGSNAFSNNSLTSITIPSWVYSTIGDYAFTGNPNLTLVTISQSHLDYTHENAFPSGVTFKNHSGNIITKTKPLDFWRDLPLLYTSYYVPYTRSYGCKVFIGK